MFPSYPHPRPSSVSSLFSTGSSRRFFFYPCLRSATLSLSLSLSSFFLFGLEREIRIELALPCPSPRGLPRTRRQTNYIIYNFELIWLHERRHASHARLSWFLFKSLSVGLGRAGDTTLFSPFYSRWHSFTYATPTFKEASPSNRFRSMVWRCPFLGFMGLAAASSNLLVDRDWTGRV